MPSRVALHVDSAERTQRRACMRVRACIHAYACVPACRLLMGKQLTSSIRVCATIGYHVSIINRYRINFVSFSLFVSSCMCSLFMDVSF